MKIRKKQKLVLQTKNVRRCIAWVSTCALIVSLLACMGPVGRETAQAAVTLHNPIYDSGVQEVEPGTQDAVGKLHNPTYDAATDTAVWDCVWFGNYWQSDTNGNGVADKNDEKEPIKWRVLSVDGDDVFLMADKNLDRKPYNEEYMDVTWETCTLRSWLNGYGSSENVCGKDYTSDNFIDNAFSAMEQAAIRTTEIVNEDNPKYGTEGGNDTRDKVYLLSVTEVFNTAYGFSNIDESSDTRVAFDTAYTTWKYGTISAEEERDYWWLRSPGSENTYVTKVGADGYLGGKEPAVNGDPVYYGDYYVIRPVLHLSLSSLPVGSYGGTVTSSWGGKATWDCVYFGNYWQNDTNRDGVADQNDKKEPIKWRILSVDGDDVFLLADKNIDVRTYNAESYKDEDEMDIGPSGVTWEFCTLRSWLNGYDGSKNDLGIDYTSDNFIDEAFSSNEQREIKNTIVVDDGNPNYGTVGGNNTVDKVYLLSHAEILDMAYGFYNKFYSSSSTRMAMNTAYAVDLEDMIERKWDILEGEMAGNMIGYWLRSPGEWSFEAETVCVDNGEGTDWYVNTLNMLVRPCLHLNLSDTTLWSYAGTVCSDGMVTDADGNIQTPTPIPTVKPTTTPIAKPTVIPTVAPTPGMTTRPASPTKSPVGNETNSTPVVGQVIKDISTNVFYQIVSTGTDAAVSYIRPETKTKKAKVPAVIYHNGKKYKVTSVAAKAFAGNKKLKTVLIGKNVKKIQKKAFANCKKLSKVTVKSKVLNKVAKNAFKGTNKKLTVKVPKKKKAKYKKLFRGKGNTKLKIK